MFPTIIFKNNISDIGLIQNLKNEVLKLFDNGSGVNTHTSFITEDNLHTLPEFDMFTKLANSEIENVLNYHSIVRGGFEISNAWANISSPSHRHSAHTHPNAFLSGVLYLSAPENCGPIVFADPRPGAGVIVPDVYDARKPTYGGVYSVQPRTGDLIIFPSWLQHSVEHGFCSESEKRIVIAFNAMIRGTICSKKTAKISL